MCLKGGYFVVENRNQMKYLNSNINITFVCFTFVCFTFPINLSGVHKRFISPLSKLRLESKIIYNPKCVMDPDEYYSILLNYLSYLAKILNLRDWECLASV